MRPRKLCIFEQLKTKKNRHKITKEFTVLSPDGIFILGKVAWFTHWRRYCFWPVHHNVLFDANCLWDIADFCARMTTEQKEIWKKRREVKQ